MNTEIIFVVEESPERGYEARALDHSIYTEADTIEQLRLMMGKSFMLPFRNTNH